MTGLHGGHGCCLYVPRHALQPLQQACHNDNNDNDGSDPWLKMTGQPGIILGFSPN